MNGDIERFNWRFLFFPGALLAATPFACIGIVAYHLNSGLPPNVTEEVFELLPKAQDLRLRERSIYGLRFSEERRGRKDSQGQVSRVWTFGEHTCSLDMPFRGMHKLWLCYELTGWTNLGTRQIDYSPSGEKLAWPFIEARLVDSSGESALLFFSLFDQEGQPFSIESDSVSMTLSQRSTSTILTAIKSQLEELRVSKAPVTFQVQLLSRCPDTVSDRQREELHELFLELREELRKKSLPAFRALMEPKR